MNRSTLAVFLAAAAIALAAGNSTTAAQSSVAADPAATSIGPATPASSDPRLVAIRTRQAQAAARGDKALARRLEAEAQVIYLEYEASPGSAADAVTFKPWQGQSLGMDGPDVFIDSGTIRATAADYEMDGTMWLAYSKSAPDSWVYVTRSSDHGTTWHGVFSVRTDPVSRVEHLGLIVGQGDSAFVYVFLVHPRQNGDMLCVRFKKNGSNALAFYMKSGADSIDNFKVCRDYSGGSYWLYCVAGKDDHDTHMDDFVLRSTDYAKSWALTNTFRYVSDGSYAAGADEYLYMAGRRGASPYMGRLNMLVNRFWGAPDSWVETSVAPDTFTVMDPVIAPSFELPAENAVIWTLYSHDFLGSGDYDMKYVYSTDAGVTWSASYYLTGSSAATERFGDIKPYSVAGNTRVNASYLSEAAFRTVYRRDCEQSTPTNWSDTLRINSNSAGTGQSTRPLLVYSPGAPGTDAGCVFVGGGLQNVYWNSPWTTAVAEERRVKPDVGLTVSPNPAAEQVRFTVPKIAGSRLAVYDAAGREVTELPAHMSTLWNRTDARGNRVPAGVYLVRLTSPTLSASRRLVLR
jgi:hypothetical protein